MFRCAVIGTVCLLAASALARSAGDSAAPSSPAPKPVVAMEEPRPGDFWTYEIRDEITGKISSIRTFVVTEVTPTEISVSVHIEGKDNVGLNVYDRSWNLTSAPPWKYQPNNGEGIVSPLKVGASRSFEGHNVNAETGNVWKRSGRSSVTGQETITTKAGTFDTFKIERSASLRPTNDPTRKQEITVQTWYAPAIDHWVRRTFVSRMNAHLVVNETSELVDYGRKK